MTEKITSYIIAEKQESLLFMAVGVLAICVALWLWMNGHRLRAMAFPLVGIALIQLVVGGTVYFRSDDQLASLAHQFETSPAEFKKVESGRMQVVIKNFTTYKWIEVALLTIGVLLILLFQRYDLAAGIGAGLVLQSAFMLCLDMFAEARGREYLEAILALPG
jgi:4-amino-4-deoxy-L-arabinose transferase-like glycosyltransferase